MKNILTPKGVYSRLVDVDKILSLEGQIRFHLGDVSIVVKQKDVVGNIIQEWLQGWFEENNIRYRANPNSQMPPDFFLDSGNTNNLLEVKAFNYEATPAFDIADFRMYAEEIVEKPWMLDVDYLIFAYQMSPQGVVTIKNIWLKKVWEITRRMADWALNLQIKSNVVHKIRPCVWYKPPRNYKAFACLEDFISAIEQTVWQNPKTKDVSGTWLAQFNNAYKSHYHKSLKIPRWTDIADKYLV